MILNEEQRLLKKTARDFLNANAPVAQLRQLRDSEDALGFSRELWEQLAAMGIPATALPEGYGGLGFGWQGLGAVMEACGRNLSATPLLASVVLGASAIELSGSEKQKQVLLEGIVAGKLTMALAIDEGYHHAPLQTAAKLEASGSNYRLDGSKVFVADGHSADKLLVVARSSGKPGDEQGLSMVLVDPAASGVQIQRTRLMDSRNFANIRFDNVAVDADDLLGAPGGAWPALAQVLDRGAACVAAEMLGGSLELFERTVQYLKDREQFDVKIGSFQALQHRAARLFCELESCKSAVLNALASLDSNAPDAARQVSLAKTLANDCYRHISNEAVQMHGGMGVTDELDVGLFLKRARVCIQLLGDNDYHEDRYATLSGF